jgi:mannose-1-phosphate guanylyltransferase/mannose-6-phosphate isomerase
MPLQPVILSGGSGTRLWPLSREAYPKQFLALTGARTMLQDTVLRLDGLAEEHPGQGLHLLDPIVVCNEAHRFLVAEQLRQLGRRPASILLEPLGRNTAPALTLAALSATAKAGVDPVLLIAPADHAIANARAFRSAVADGALLADEGAVITFGIVPSKPETGYGYLQQGEALAHPGLEGAGYRLNAFVEKPDAETAQRYLASGEYLWNSGLFMMRASVWLELIRRFRPEIASECEAAYAGGARDGDFHRLEGARFAACASDSIDYAVMERLAGAEAPPEHAAVVLPLDAGWSDVGAWGALWELRERDAAGNVLDGDAFVHESSNNLLIAQHRMLAAVGVEDLIVVTQFLGAAGRDEHRHHRRVHRPWGAFESVTRGPRYQVKRLTVNPGEALSMQMHHHRAEHWVVVSGTARVTRGEESFLLTENESTYIPVGTRHRLENPGTIALEIIEVQSGSYLGEDDIVRFDDRYHRGAETG